MRVERVARLEDGGVGIAAVQLDDALVGAVVGPAIELDRPVDAVDDARAGRRLAVEQVRVEEHAARPGREPAVGDPQAAALELPAERPEELMRAAVRRRPQPLRDRDVRSAQPHDATSSRKSP